MSDPTLADEIAAIFRNDAAPLIAEAFHADSYELVRFTPVKDGRAGWTVTEEVLEPGRCKLMAATRQGAIRMSGDVVLPVAPYTAELPYTSVVTGSDNIRINGREFKQASPPRRSGNAGMFTVLELEAV